MTAGLYTFIKYKLHLIIAKKTLGHILNNVGQLWPAVMDGPPRNTESKVSDVRGMLTAESKPTSEC